MKVAIVGQGPKGLYALAELVRAWPGTEPLDVHTYDPSPPGSGTAYATDQPDFLRLNVTPSIVHLPPMPPMAEWLRERGTDPDGDVPRAMVGRYLAEAHRRIVSEAPPGTTVLHHPSTVRHVSPVPQGWLVGATMPQVVDEVLLATGHARNHDNELAHRWRSDQPTRLVPGVYPVGTMLDEATVPPGSVVAVRGAALTFIDACLALTEGRAPDKWPAKILPIAPSGMLMHSKPAPGFQLQADEREALALLAQTMPADPDGAIATVAQGAAELLVLSGWQREAATAAADHTLRTGWEPGRDRAPRALDALNQSIAVAEYAATPGPAWMLARAWATLYPAVVGALSFTTPDPEGWQRFLRTAGVLEKLTFGPPPANARRLSALCERGIVDLRWLEGDVRVTDTIENIPDGQATPDVLVDAVLSPPGAAGARHPVVDDLLASGTVRLAAGRRGLEITPDACCVGADGTPTPGLGALGRPVEDVVIGNDTLGQSLHDQARRWAARVARGARR